VHANYFDVFLNFGWTPLNKEMHAAFEMHAGQVELDRSLVYVYMGV